MLRTKYDWGFHTEQKTACRAQVNGCYWPRGKMLGGSSSINGMIYVRGTDRDYNRWAAAGNIGWDYESVLPYYKKSEANQYQPFVAYQNGRYHNANGPMKIDFFGDYYESDKIFFEAAKERGVPFGDDINADKHLGYLNAQGTIFQGRRVSTAHAFLIPAMHRPNLRIIKHAFVKKILINDQNRAYGVKFTIKGKKKMKAFAKKEVILSAGTVQSPVLLMISGIGPKKHLEKHNISMKADLQVGKNVMDHVIVNAFFAFNPTETVSTSQFDGIYNFAIYNTGYLVSGRMLSAFVNSKNDSSYADIQFYPIYFTRNTLSSYLDDMEYNENIKQTLNKVNENYDVAVIRINLLVPKSKGQILLRSKSACDPPIIKPNYLSENEDMATLVRALKEQIAYSSTKSYRSNGGHFIKIPLDDCDGLKYMSQEYLECYIRSFSYTDYHPVGSSKMGPKYDRSAVVDPQLRVYQIDGLRQIDAGM